MAKYIFAVVMLMFAAASWLFFGIGVSPIYTTETLAQKTPHVYGDPSKKISQITIFAFYFVPKNKQQQKTEHWHELLENGLKKLQEFHSLQFQGRSSVSYDIFPEPVIGLQNNLYYDTDVTQGGNPHALIHIAQELEQRALRETGDLFRGHLDSRKNGAYPILLILYEGIGSSGGIINESSHESVGAIAKELGLPESVIFLVDVKAVDGFMILNTAYLNKAEFQLNGLSVLAHEFYHALGAPDFYDHITAVVSSQDIMGQGREQSLDKTYIDRKLIKAFGL